MISLTACAEGLEGEAWCTRVPEAAQPAAAQYRQQQGASSSGGTSDGTGRQDVCQSCLLLPGDRLALGDERR